MPRTATIAVRPVLLPTAPERGDDLQVRVTAPVAGDALPLVVFSHGFGASMDAYGPLIDHWAEQGFAVVAPTHLDSFSLGLAPDDPRTPSIWRLRIADVVAVLDRLDAVEAAVPGLAGRIDRGRIAVAGHSYGATTVSALLGARVLAGGGDPDEDFTDPRVGRGVLLSLAGTGGADLSPFAAEQFAFMDPGFAEMAAPALIVAGGDDQSPLSVRGPDWFTDAYRLSPAPKTLLTIPGAQHSLGGVNKPLGMPETPADKLEWVALVQAVTTAFLRGDSTLPVDAALGQIEAK